MLPKIKLVLWDIDDTFWKGTISEGNIEIIYENIEIVKKLTDRGIINSIVSKNDFDIIKEKLVKIGIWGYFVFPKIQWAPKGEQIRSLLEEVQLRAENTLFIDDNHINLEEAKFYNDKLNVVTPEFIKDILTHASFQGKDDRKHTRLKQYKILEKKAVASTNYSENSDFLKQSNIKIKLITNIEICKDRIDELISRTNQLNYTKKRILIEELDDLIDNKDKYNLGAVHVSDKYGDYGICGFYCLDKKENELIHFLFSCRVMNLGIEQYCYAMLGFPKIDIVGEVAALLTKEKPDYIELLINDDIPSNQVENKNNKYKILLKGGCDLLQMINYFHYKDLEIVDEMNYVLSNNMIVHREHTEMLKNSIYLDSNQKNDISNFIPFFDANAFNTKVFEENYDILVYSILMDYTQELYENKDTNIRIVFGGYNNILNEDNQIFEKKYKNRNIRDMNAIFLHEFKNKYNHIGQITPEMFYDNLSFLRDSISKPIVFINGAEIGNEAPSERGSIKRHKLMNKALDKFIAETKDTYLVDMRSIVKFEYETTNNIRHYQKAVYNRMSKELVDIVEKITNDKMKKNQLKYIIIELIRYIKKIKRKASKLLKDNK